MDSTSTLPTLKAIRERNEWEIKLLDSRTTLFLLACALAANAVASSESCIRLYVILPAFGVTCLWSRSSYLSMRLIGKLKDLENQKVKALNDGSEEEEVDLRLIEQNLTQAFWKYEPHERPSTIIGYCLPNLLLLSWGVALFFHLPFWK